MGTRIDDLMALVDDLVREVVNRAYCESSFNRFGVSQAMRQEDEALATLRTAIEQALAEATQSARSRHER
jgi:hypothetical protein